MRGVDGLVEVSIDPDGSLSGVPEGTATLELHEPTESEFGWDVHVIGVEEDGTLSGSEGALGQLRSFAMRARPTAFRRPSRLQIKKPAPSSARMCLLVQRRFEVACKNVAWSIISSDFPTTLMNNSQQNGIRVDIKWPAPKQPDVFIVSVKGLVMALQRAGYNVSWITGPTELARLQLNEPIQNGNTYVDFLPGMGLKVLVSLT